MRRVPYDLLATLFLAGAGLGLTFLPTTAPSASLRVTSGVAATGFLLATFLVLTGLRRRVERPTGFLPLLLGLLLLAVGAVLTPFPDATRAVLSRSPLYLRHEDLLEIAQAVGALAVALGFSVWVRTLVHRSVRAEMRRQTLEREVEHLGQKVRTQEANLREMDLLDGLTGVLNRRAFLAALGDTVQRDARLGEPFAFALVRAADHDEVAGQQGQGSGNLLLREVARALRGATRGTDIIGRLAPGDFGVVLGECQDPTPALQRVVFALEGGPGATKKNPVRVQIAALCVDAPVDLPQFAELSEAAERLVRSLPHDSGSRILREPFRRSRPLRAEVS